ncbi:MAG: GFA family protein [Rhodospirillales bacterium]|jgi:hypothetical protein|nr:GFA family protein [Rhodospirillales bacterium]
MILKGSCHCGAVHFCLESPHPYPFNHCYCSICRKTQGGGGFAINLSGDADTLEVEGKNNITIYQATSPAQRHFCHVCGSGLWVWDSRWPELVHPFASAIDTDLPTPPERTHLMLSSKASWVPVHADAADKTFDAYPDESIAAWHERLELRR